MPTGALLVYPQPQAVDAAGVPIAGAQLFSFATGTNTPQATYADSALVTPNLNPQIADARGAFGVCFLDPTLTYRMKLEDADGATIWVADGIGYSWITSQITAAVAVETARAEASEAALSAAIASATTAQSAVNTALSDAITAETARAEAAEAALAAVDADLQAQINALPGATGGGSRAGNFSDASSSAFTVTFDPPFTTACVYITPQPINPISDPPIFLQLATLTNTGATGTLVDNFNVPVFGPCNWFAEGY